MGISSRHLLLEEISAFVDGELVPATLRMAREHVSECATCRSMVEAFGQVERDLQQPPVLSCAVALPLISARADGEADEADSAAAERHVRGCADCREGAVRWAAIPGSLDQLPHGSPSARVDRRVAQLGQPGRPSIIPAFAARGLVAVTAVIAIVVTGLSQGAAPLTPAAQLEPNSVVVAAVQDVVFNPRTGTLYVLDTQGAAVDARDAATNTLKARIEVGGRPTALALNESANTVLVLDAQQKRVTEIDGATNTVIGSSAVAVTGTPTSIGVDPASSKIVVTSTGTTGTTTNTNGSVAVIDGTTKKVETVRDVSVSPQLVVFDPAKGRAALISKDSTTMVDESYRAIATLGGGVSGAFAQGDDRLAVLSAKGSGSLVTYTGRSAPLALELAGNPRTIVSLPDGGFLVLVDMGGRSRVSYLAPDGHEAGNVDLAIAGGDLIYDPAARRFSVVGRGEVVSAGVPQVIAAAAPTPSTTQAPSRSANPTAEPSASSSASASPSPSAQPSATPAASQAPTALDAAQSVAPNVRHIDLPGGRQPILVSKSGERLWVLDQRNGVDTVDLSTGDVFTVTSLHPSAKVSYWAAGRQYVYGIDARSGQLHVVHAPSESVTSLSLNFLKPVSAIAVGSDDRLWIGLVGAPYLLRFDPKTSGMDTFDLGPARVSALTVDESGRILYADDARGTVGTYDPRTGLLSEVTFAKRGATTGLLVDRSSTLWLATAVGEIFSVRGGVATLALSMPRPVAALTLDSSGHPWYLAPLPEGRVGSAYGSLRGDGRGGTIAGPASSLSFSALGYAWLADPVGGFYIVDRGGG